MPVPLPLAGQVRQRLGLGGGGCVNCLHEGGDEGGREVQDGKVEVGGGAEEGAIGVQRGRIIFLG